MNFSHNSIYAQHNNSTYDIAFLTVADISEFMGVSKSKLYKDIRDGKLAVEKNLDDTTVISPRELQSAYPDINVAEIFDIDLPPTQANETTSEITDLLTSPVTAISADDRLKVKKNSGLSSLEMALNKQRGDDVSFAPPDDEPTCETKLVDVLNEPVVEKNEPRPLSPGTRKFTNLTAALVLVSSILLVVLAIL